tara:strand:+ start:274 stop:1038 length:765 start_codon:yes stop_codon:yes gene_type:complete
MAPFIGSSPAEVALTTGDLGDDIVTESKMANDAIGLTELKAGTDGELITWDASGNPAAVAVGTATHVLTSNGAGAAPTFQAAGGGYEFVSSGSASGGASIDFTNMVDGYDYIYVFQHISSASDGVSWTAEVGVSGPTYRTSGYKSSLVGINNAGSSTSIESTSHFLMVSSSNEGMGTGSGEAIKGGEFVLFNPANSSTETAGQSQVVLYGASPQLVPKFGAGYYATAEANVAVRFKTSSGNCTGTIFQFRRARS